MPDKHRIVIIGAGAIAGMHAKAIGDIGNAELIAACSRTESTVQKFGDSHGCRPYTDVGAMLDAEKPDVACITSPSGAHLEHALAATERGVHVLCEKPLEISTDRVDRMIDAAREAGVRLGGIFPQRYNPVLRAVHDAAAAGRFGDLAVVNSYVPWWRDEAYYAPDRWQGTLAMDGGGALMNQSIHGVDAVQWLAAAAGAGAEGNPVEEVFAWCAKRGHDEKLIEVEDTAVAVLRFRNGTLGQILGATSMYPGTFKRIQIAGRDGTAEILEDELVTFSFRDQREDDDAIRRRFGAATSTGGGASDPMAIDYANHTRNITAFLETLDGGNAGAIDGPEARKAVAIIEAIYASAKSGRAARVA